MNDFVEEILELEVIIVNFALFLRRRVSRFLHAQMSHAIQTLQSDELLCSFGTEIRYGVGYNRKRRRESLDFYRNGKGGGGGVEGGGGG